MRAPYYQVDVFTSRHFGGNPAGVCLLDNWLPDITLQQIAAENNQAETAFLVTEGQGFRLRWFTPLVEVDLCGHATLAPAFVLFADRGWQGPRIEFQTRSGLLLAEQRGDIIELDFPSRMPVPASAPDELLKGLGRKPKEVLKARDFMAVYSSQAQVASLTPDMALLAKLDCLGIIATAPGEDCDFVSRFFAPGAGVPEDPATGSSHSTLIPFWAQRLGKETMFARQISKRGGEIYCRNSKDRVGIGGRAVIYSRGHIEIPSVN